MPLRHRPLRPASASLALRLALALGVLAGGPFSAQTADADADVGPAPGTGTGILAAPHPDGPVFIVSEFRVESDAGPIDGLLPIDVPLARLPTGLVKPSGSSPADPVPFAIGRPVLDATQGDERRYHASAIEAITQVMVARLQELGWVGVRVAPDPEDVDVATERDLRPEEQRWMRLLVSIGRVRELRSVAVGDRVKSEWKVNNPIHREIRRASPIQPSGVLTDDTTDILDRERLEDYLFQLNRHSGRRVDAALAASEDGEGIALDLRVYESKPWFAYFQSSDTGPERTDKWQQRFGVVHRQLTGRDDILSLQYTNAGGDSLNAIYGSYEAPWFGSRRPDWLKSQPDEPGWLRWMNRDAWPWIGGGGFRWRVSGAWSRFDTDTFDIGDKVRGSEWSVDWRLLYEAFQYRNLFVDAFIGTRFQKVDVLNRNFQVDDSADEFFVLPEIGLRLDRVQETSNLRGLLSFETNLSSTSVDDISLLGRQAPDGDWKLLRYDFGISQFLEPLLFPEAWKDPSTPLSSTLAHEIALGIRGQYSFGDRLIPQATQGLGGLFSVRGYEQSASYGDSAYVASFEYRFHLPHALPIQRKPMQVPLLGEFRAAPQQVWGFPDWDLALKGFVDYGRTNRYVNGLSNVRPAGGGPSNREVLGRREPDEELLGVGAGVEFRFKQYLSMRAEWGRALKKTLSVSRGNDEFHFLISIQY